MRKTVIIALALLCLRPSATASETPDSIAAELSEVSVTAIKQATSLALQPVASTTISAAEVQRQRIVTMKQASEIVPNFFIPDYGSRITSTIYVRGLGARIDQPAVGLNIDNIPILNKNDYDFDLCDIERIEVLRGPQSVLYGRNTMGGLINIYTLSPTRWQGVRLLGEFGSGTSWRFGAGIYRLLQPGLGMSLSVNASGTKGFFRNDFNNSNVGKGHQASLRWKTVYEPADKDFSLENVVSFNLNRENGYPYEWLETGQIAYNDTCYYHRTSLIEGLTLQWRSDKFTVSSITGLRYMDDDMTLDQDFTPKRYFTLTQATREWSVTHDVVFRGSAGKTYSWLAGAFGFFKHGRMNAPVTFLSDGIQELIIANAMSAMPPGMAMRWDSDSFVLGSRFTIPVGGAAVYHESTFNLGSWKLAAAMRLDYEHTALKARSFTSTSCTVNAFGREMTREVNIDEVNRFAKHFIQFLPRITATYRLPMPSPSSVYASVSKGYKAGGYNTQMFSDVLQQQLMVEMSGRGELPDIGKTVSYKPEQSWNFEVGSHIACADGRIHTDLALFYIDCRNQQLTCFPDEKSTGRMMTNAARTRSLGLEASVTARPTDRVEVIATYGLTDARFVRYNDGKSDFADKIIPYAPRHTIFGSVTYSQPTKLKQLTSVDINANCRAVGPIYWDEANLYRQNLYALLGASISLVNPHGALDFWAENILNSRYSTFYFESIGHSFVQRGKPRRLGVTLRINL